jgi:hypothetical protein|tara:strand:+ start:57 stop:311 length:255 start_codon:yes stop_codon:yes gene_type:complete
MLQAYSNRNFKGKFMSKEYTCKRLMGDAKLTAGELARTLQDEEKAFISNNRKAYKLFNMTYKMSSSDEPMYVRNRKFVKYMTTS